MNTVKIAGRDLDERQLQVLEELELLQIGQKDNPASLTLTAPALQGPFQGSTTQYGIFTGAGVRPQRWSAMQRPWSLSSLLTPTPSPYVNEILEIVTGQTAGGTTNATSFTGNPPTVGQLKVARMSFTWGSYYVKTDLNAVPLIGQLRDRADVPGEILNAGPRANPLIPDTMFGLPDTRSQLRYELFRIGTDLERTMEQVLINGSAGTDNSRTGWFAEFAGLDGQIKTGYTDSATGVTVSAMDSAVTSFNADIASTAAGGDGRTFTECMEDIYYGLKDRAVRVGLDVTYVIVMRSELFRRAAQTVAYQSPINFKVGDAAATPVQRDGIATQQMRLEMQNGRFLYLAGDRVPVVFSAGMEFTGLSNLNFKSDIFFVPIDSNAGPTLRLEYFKMDNQYASEYAAFADADEIRYLNNGMFIVGKRSIGLAVEFHFAARFRLILETPFLSGRLDDVAFTYKAPSRTSIPGQSLYVNGGLTYRL